MNHKMRIVWASIIVVISFSVPAFANMDKAEHADFIQTLRQSAVELKGSNPILSDKLNGYADKQEKWTREKEQRWNQKREDAGVIRTAAAELQSGRKDISDDLNDIADRDVKKGAGTAETDK